MRGKIYTLTEAAELCDTHRVTLWRWVKSGRLTAYQTPTGHYRIKAGDLNRFIKANLPFIELKGSDTHPTILIVDDEPAFRQMVKRMFHKNGFRLEEAANGFEAGKKIMTLMPAIVILDLYMPKIDGFDLCRQIKNDPDTRHINIIAVTGHASPATEEKIRKLGADAYLEKPFEPGELRACIDQLIS